MDASNMLSAVLEYRDELASVAESLRLLSGVCWTLNYFSMMYISGRDKVPNTNVFAITNDMAWEFMYAFIHPAASAHWEGGVKVWFLVHCAVVLYILKFAPNEWDDVPIVKRNIYLIYTVSFLGFLAGQWAFAAEVGPDLGFFYGGVLCQTLASLGPNCQLLARNSIRGASLLTWSLRAVATFGGFIKLTIYYLTDVPAGPWFESPMCKFYIGLTLVLDFVYPFLYFSVWRQEAARTPSGKKIQ
uniref:Putative terpene cyclase n=1 Tax=Emericella variicolor TaxID=1549217 RepID=A0A1L7NQ76_EMEVA|nr:putative terpene cyclase [Aspergillus stellatus]